MSKERILTVLVPIKDSDCDSTVYGDLAALQTAVPASASNVNVIYKVKDGTYYRSYYNGASYAYKAVVDREFPFLGEPMEIYDFTYDANRMGNAPTISAQNVMWYATKGTYDEDVTLDDLWVQECHVIFNGENLYLKQIPTSGKSNEDARYKYDLDFVDESVVLERVYLYDVVSPFITDKPLSESATFSFFGDIQDFANRINASLIRSGLSSLVRKYVPYPHDQNTNVPYLSYEQWNSMLVNPLPLIGTMFYDIAEMVNFRIFIYLPLDGDYNRYLQTYIFENDNGVYELHGYQCVIGTDKYGDIQTSEEKLVSFDKAYIKDALKEFHDTFELQYYITKEKDGNGDFTGDTLIVVGDCEYDFADWDSEEDDYVRDNDGVPTTNAPFDYGVNDELLSKEKTNTTDKIVSRITGVGSTENIPWYYPNPTPDGWIRPVFTRNGEPVQGVTVDYPVDEGSTAADYARYEKFLKNRVGVSINKGVLKDVIYESRFDSIRTTYVSVSGSAYRDTVYQVTYKIDTTDMLPATPSITIELDYNPSLSACSKIFAKLTRGDVTVGTYDSDSTYSEPTAFQAMFMYQDGKHKQNLAGGYLYLLRIDYRIPYGQSPEPYYNHEGYFYEAHTFDYPDTLPSDYTDGQGRTHHYIAAPAYIGENFYQYEDLLPYAIWTESEEEVLHALIVIHALVPIESGYSTNGDETTAVAPIDRIRGDWYKDLATDDIYECNTSADNDPATGYPSEPFTIDPTMEPSAWVNNFVNMSLRLWSNDGWYIESNQIQLSDYGLGWPSDDGGLSPLANTDIFDKIEFQRVKWLTQKQNLMPEVYIKTDGERRFYNAKNYWDADEESLVYGTADTAIGEEQVGLNQIRNNIFKENETDADSEHYEFENEYSQAFPHEHIEDMEDVKPTIKEQTNIVDGHVIRIDVVESFAYDLTDNDEIWEESKDGSVEGEYKHPYFFAKLRPLGFNLFDMALQEDMVLSMTTGDCGACNFKIGVDENSKKNPVQLWEYDVYRGDDLLSENLLYEAGTLRRYVDLTGLYYDTPNGAVPIKSSEGILEGDEPLYFSSTNMFQMYNYTAEAVKNGFVGTMKQRGALHFEGDVVTDGRFIESQQDTTENYVWVALMKDTETYGKDAENYDVIMPSSRPNYKDPNLNQYIRPKSIEDVHTQISTPTIDEEKADKFVLTNIRLPQIYLRRAERELSRELVKYMYENNYHKFNFSIKFSRIYIDDNPDTDDNLNENSVLYVRYNGRTYRQYVKHYSYKMTHDSPLPEISVDMDEELSVTKTISQRWDELAKRNNSKAVSSFNSKISKVQNRIERTTLKKDGTYMFSGNIILDGENTSLIEMARASKGEGGEGDGADVEAITIQEIDEICV